MRHFTAFAIVLLVPVYVSGVFVADVLAPTEERKPVTVNNKILTISFVGDMMFDRYIRERAVTAGYGVIFSDVLPILESSDLVVGNLEGPITAFESVSDWRDNGPNHYKFTFATTVAGTLHTAGFSAVSLANNHSMNFGDKGLLETKYWLEENNIGYFGAPDELYVPWRYASGSIPVAIYGIDLSYVRDIDLLVENLKKEASGTFVVVYAHWGDEYHLTPSEAQRGFAHSLVDAGANLVIGAHPHVIQTKEQYHNAWIYYSLGNFIFDQYFNDAVRCGSVVYVHIAHDGTYTTEEKFVKLEGDGTTKQSQCTVQIPFE